MKKLYITIIIAFISMNVFSQVPNWAWAKTDSVGGIVDVLGTTTDSNGNVFICGMFDTTATFGSTTLTCIATTEEGLAFIAKFDSTGQAIWAKQVTHNSGSMAFSIATDGEGNAFITGFFDGPSAVFGNDTIFGYPSGPSSSIFLVKYNSNGDVLWVRGSPDPQNPEEFYGVATDVSGDAIITGHYVGYVIHFGNDSIVSPGTTYGGVFIVKYDPLGNVIWAKGASGNSQPYCNSIAVDVSGNCYIEGWFNHPNLIFETDTLTALHEYNSVFFAKYDAAGNFIWAKKVGGTGYIRGNSLAINSYGKIFVSGNTGQSGRITFDTIMYNVDSLSCSPFIAQYNSSGGLEWARVGMSTSPVPYSVVNCFNVVADDCGGALLVGGLYGGNNLTFGSISLSSVPAFVFDDMYMFKFNSSGTATWGTTLKGGGDDQCGVAYYNNSFYFGDDFRPDTLIVGNDTVIKAGNAVETYFLAKLHSPCSTSGVSSITNHQSTLTLSPNPATSNLTITNQQSSISSIHIYSVLGELVYQSSINNNQSTININVSNLTNGMYFIEATTDKGIVRKKFIKQ
jgi:hypothetical protein